MKTIFRRSPNLSRFGLAFVAGLLLMLSFPKFNLGWLAWFAPGLLLWTCIGQSGKTVFRLGVTAGLGYYGCSLYWLLLIPLRWHGFAAWLSMAIGMALCLSVWCGVCWRCLPGETKSRSWQRRAVWAAFCGVAWVAMEMCLTRLGFGFPWNLLGASQYQFLPLIQIASITGIYGVSFLVIWTSVAVAVAVSATRHTRPSLLDLGRELAAPGMVLTGVLLFGGIKLMSPDTPRGHLKVALVQPGIPQSIIWDVNERTNRVQKLLELSHAALAQHPDLLVWPEAALPPNLIGRTRNTQEIITSLVRSNLVWMIFGVVDTAGTHNEIQFNSAFFIDPVGDLIARYHKQKLVVFGEYMPATRWFPFLKKLRADGAGLQAGRGPVHFQMGNARARIAPLICFEDVFPSLARKSVDSETDFLLNLTNNGWFGVGAAQWQHAVSALFRAIENNVPLVRCTNNGLTCWIDSCGRLHDVYFPGSTDVYQAGFKIVEIPLRSLSEKQNRQTIYNLLGDWFGFLCVAITGSTLAWILMQKKRRQGGAKLV